MKNDSNELTQAKLSELILAIFSHPNSPNWLVSGLWDAINDNSYVNAFDPDNIKLMLESADIDRSRA